MEISWQVIEEVVEWSYSLWMCVSTTYSQLFLKFESTESLFQHITCGLACYFFNHFDESTSHYWENWRLKGEVFFWKINMLSGFPKIQNNLLSGFTSIQYLLASCLAYSVLELHWRKVWALFRFIISFCIMSFCYF